MAFSLSDAQCVERHRPAFAAAIGNAVKLVFANETEIMSLFEVASFETAVQRAAKVDALFAITRSEKGSVIVSGRERVVQEAYPVKKVIDATGAGDAYTAAFLYAKTNGRSLKECADLGSRAATAVIQQVGARLEKDALYRIA
jgi:sugar/nucleoside kinase (ribokinase family)